ncbi:hypothetical protein FD754_020607, partial [Muntiacus muntjak]
ENIIIQETSTTLSQQIDLKTPSQVTGLKPQKTAYSSTVVSKSMPVFATDYTTRLTSVGPTTNSMKVTKSPSSESTRTTKMAESIAIETSHPVVATNFLYTSRFTNNSIVSKPSVTESQLAVMRTASLFSPVESTSMSTTFWPKHKSTGIGALPIATVSQEFPASTAAGSVRQSTVDLTSTTATPFGTASTLPPESVLISTAVSMNSVFPRNQTAQGWGSLHPHWPQLIWKYLVYSTRSIKMTPVLRTVETESPSTNFQADSSPTVEDAISNFIPKEVSFVALSFRTSSPFTRAQSVQTVTDVEMTHTALTPGKTLAPTVAETLFSSTITGPVYALNIPTGGENMLPLISTRSASTSKESTSDEGDHLFSTNEITWTSRPDQTFLTSVLNGSTSNTEHSSTTTNIIIQPEASMESKVTTIANTTTDRYKTVLSKLTSPWFTNFSTVSGVTSVTKQPESKFSTLLLKTTPASTVLGNELLSTPRETVVPLSASENTQTQTNGIIAFGETTVPVPGSAMTQRFIATVTRKETTSHYLERKSALAVTTKVSPFATMLKATDESISPFLDAEKLTTQLDNTTTAEVKESWFSTKSMKTTPKSSYNETMAIFNSTHIYIAPWTSETPPEGNPTPSPTSGSTQTPSISTSSNTVEAHVSEMSTALTITTLLSPETGSRSALSVYTPRTEKKIVSTTSVTHPFSHRQDTSFVDTVTPGTTRISNPINNNTTFFTLAFTYLGLSPSSTVSSANFIAVSTDRITTALSASNVSIALLGKTSMIITSVATSGLGSEMSSMSVSVSAFPPLTVSSDASTTGGSFYTSSSVTPRPSMTMQTLSLDVTPLTYAGSASKSTVTSVGFTTSEITKVSSSITPTSSPAEPTFPSGKTIPTTIMAGTAISSIPKTTFSSILSTAQQSSQRYQATTLGIFPGITNSSLSTVSSGKVIALTNTYSRTVAPESVLSSTLENLHASLNIQFSPSLTGFKSTPGSTKSAMSVNTPVSYPPWIPSGSTSPSLTSVLVSPQSTETKFSTPKTSLPPMSQTVEFPVLQTRTTTSNTQSLLLTFWNTPTAEDSQFSASTTAYVPTSNKKQTESPYVSTESLSTFPVSQTGLVPGDVMAMSSISTTGTLPTLGMSESPSLSISSKSIPVTLADIKHTFEKTTTSASTSPMLTWILSSLPSGSPLATRSNTHIISSSPEEVLKSTFLTSGITPTHPLTNFTIRPFAGVSAVLETTPTPTVGGITAGFPSPFPVSIKITDDSTYISKSSEAFSRITVTANSRTVPQAPSFRRMSKSPPVDHTPSVGAMFLPSPTTTSAWSRIPAASAPTTLVLPKPTQESLLNIAATTSTATGAPFPLISTGVTHPFTANVSSLPSSSFETGWPDSTPSFLSTETSTLPIVVKS